MQSATDPKGLATAGCPQCPPVKTSASVLCPQHVARTLGAGVVSIRCVPTFKTFFDQKDRWLEPTASHYGGGLLPVRTTGFFTPKGYIVSQGSFNTIWAISCVVMTFSTSFCWKPGMNEMHKGIPGFKVAREDDPSTNLSNRYNEIPGFTQVLDEMCHGGCFADFLEFYVDVTSPNNQNGCALTYAARLVGIDFETGLCWFRITKDLSWNACLDRITKQVVLKYGNSKSALPGSPVHVLYDSRLSGPQTMNSGVVTANVSMVEDGSIPFEVITTNMVVEEGAEGAPILNACGQVIGVVTGTSKSHTAVAITSAFMERIHNAILENLKARNTNDYSVFINSFGCEVYRHGTLSMSYHVRTGMDLNQALLRTSVGECPCDSKCDGGCGTQRNTMEYYNNEFYYNCRMNREIIGVVLDTEPTGPLADAVETCQFRDPNFGQMQKRYFRLEKGDIITHINNMPLGTRPGQQSPENIFYSLKYCACIELTFLKESERYTEEHRVSVELQDSIVWIADFSPCCMPCLKYDVQDIVKCFSEFCTKGSSDGFGRVMDRSIGKIVDIDLCILEAGAELLNAINCWFHLMRWFLHTIPAVYRAALMSNTLALFKHLSEWISIFTTPQPVGCCLWGIPVFTPLSVGAALGQISRISIATVATPSIVTSVKPCPFYDYTASFPHSSDISTFDQYLPNGLALIGSKLTQYARAYSLQKAATSDAEATLDSSFTFPVYADEVQRAFPVDEDEVQRDAKRARKE